MKTLRALFLIACIALVSSGVDAKIFRFGPRVGVNVNHMSLSKSTLSSDNRAGFTGGLMAEINIPVINLGFDVSAMYVHRSSSLSGISSDADETALANAMKSRDYIEIPVNLKYKLGLPVVGKFLSPYFFTGPSFAFLTSKEAITEAYESKKMDVSWNFGVGLEIINHLQIGASYGLGISNTVNKIGVASNATAIEGKNNCWTITAAWLF